jgi:hypothetical protein
VAREIELTGTLIPAAVDLIAEEGHHLIVINGVCVGVHTGDVKNGRAVAKTALPGSRRGPDRLLIAHDKPADEDEPPPRGKTKAANKKRHLSATTPELDKYNPETVMTACRALARHNKVINTLTIANEMKLARSATAERAKVWRVVDKLYADRMLMRSAEKTDMKWEYTILADAASAKGKKAPKGTNGAGNSETSEIETMAAD